MPVQPTRRDLLARSAAVAALPPLRTAFGQTAPADEGPGATDLQRDLAQAIARHRVVGASAAVYRGGEIARRPAGRRPGSPRLPPETAP